MKPFVYRFIKGMTTSGKLGELSRSAMAVLWVLVQHADPEGVAYPGRTTIGQGTGLSTSAVDRGLRELKQKGVIAYSEGFQGGRHQKAKRQLLLQKTPHDSGEDRDCETPHDSGEDNGCKPPRPAPETSPPCAYKPPRPAPVNLPRQRLQNNHEQLNEQQQQQGAGAAAADDDENPITGLLDIAGVHDPARQEFLDNPLVTPELVVRCWREAVKSTDEKRRTGLFITFVRAAVRRASARVEVAV